MSKQLICDQCKTTRMLNPDEVFDAFPEGWVNVTVRHEGSVPHEYRDYCNAGCAVAALAERAK